ncbi:MAG: Franean1_4349 family RiPP [Caldilineales bacterium]|nr:Franean1_4349 family RiPP [Caldilineales bacterium]
MTTEAVQSIIGRAVTEAAFRSALFADPDQALAGYALTDAEKASLRAIDFETMDSFAGALDDRISKAFALGSLFGADMGAAALGGMDAGSSAGAGLGAADPAGSGATGFAAWDPGNSGDAGFAAWDPGNTGDAGFAAWSPDNAGAGLGADAGSAGSVGLGADAGSSSVPFADGSIGMGADAGSSAGAGQIGFASEIMRNP